MLPQPLAAELLDAPLIANLATFNEDATIHLVPVWFLWDSEALLAPTAGSSRKARNLAQADAARELRESGEFAPPFLS